MNKNKVYSMNQMTDIGFDPLPYKMMEQEGEFKATLDFKRWGRKQNLVAYFSVDEIGKIVASTFWNREYLNLKEIPIGSRLIITFYRKGKTGNYLRKIQVLDAKGNIKETYE